MHYDPEIAPAPELWLSLDEQERIKIAAPFHKAAKIQVPNLKAHAVFHAIVENQIAEGLDPVVRAIARLTKQGLSRHDSIHAIGFVVAEHLFEALNTEDQDIAEVARARYNAALERLNEKSWRARGGA